MFIDKGGLKDLWGSVGVSLEFCNLYRFGRMLGLDSCGRPLLVIWVALRVAALHTMLSLRVR